MTNEDAIKWLENLKQDIGQLRHEDLWPYAQAIEEIMELLKEEDAVVPELAQTPDGIYATCGKCKTNLLMIMGIKFTVSPDDMPRFCPKCGQAVKWE